MELMSSNMVNVSTEASVDRDWETTHSSLGSSVDR